jgi:protein-disulfide isomerase
MAGGAEFHAAESLSTRFEAGAHVAALGADDAPVTVVEFVDFRCGFCAVQARVAFDEIRRRYIDAGLVRYLAVELPLLGPDAERDALAVRCAGVQGKYWPAHRALLMDAPLPRSTQLELGWLAEAASVDGARLAACVEGGEQRALLDEGIARAHAHRVDATPTFFIGFPAPGENALTVERYMVGAQGGGPVIDAIEALLTSRRAQQLRDRVDR